MVGLSCYWDSGEIIFAIMEVLPTPWENNLCQYWQTGGSELVKLQRQMNLFIKFFAKGATE